MSEYDGKQFVGIDLHRQRSVIVRQTDSGEQLAVARIVNDPASLALQLEKAGVHFRFGDKCMPVVVLVFESGP